MPGLSWPPIRLHEAAMVEQLFINAVGPDGQPLELAVAGGRFAAIGPNLPRTEGAALVDLGGQLVLPGFVDGHIHLDKSFVGDRWHPHRPAQTLRERLAIEKQELAAAPSIVERADALVDAMSEPGRAISAYWEALREQGDFELIINATSAGRSDGAAFSLPLSLVNSLTTAVDLNYGEAAIPFLAWARAAGCRNYFDGLGMLVEQAAESFQQWHGVRPATDEVYAGLRERAATLVTAD